MTHLRINLKTISVNLAPGDRHQLHPYASIEDKATFTITFLAFNVSALRKHLRSVTLQL